MRRGAAAAAVCLAGGAAHACPSCAGIAGSAFVVATAVLFFMPLALVAALVLWLRAEGGDESARRWLGRLVRGVAAVSALAFLLLLVR